jgi:uncharacterized protein (DUF2126 family)
MSLAQQVLLRALIARSGAPGLKGPVRAGARRCMTASCCPSISCGRISSTCCAISPITASICDPEWFEAQARVPLPVLRRGRGMRASISSCGRRWSPGMCWARPAPSAARCATPTARSERLQVKLTTPDPSATRDACNGGPCRWRRRGEAAFRGGVRFKAWQPAMALHPVLPVDAPLTFDIYRHAGRAGRWAAASITSRIRAGAITRPSRSTATRPRPGGWRGSSPWPHARRSAPQAGDLIRAHIRNGQAPWPLQHP